MGVYNKIKKEMAVKGEFKVMLKNLLNRLMNTSLKLMILTSFAVILTVSLSILGAISYYVSYQGFITTGMSNYTQLLIQTCNNINLHFDEIKSITDSISNESSIKYREGYFKTVKKEKNGYEESKYILFNEKSKRSDIDDINVYYNNDEIISNFNMYSKDDLKQVVNYYNINEIYLKSKIVPIVLSNKSGTRVFSAVKSIYPPDESGYNNGFVIVNFSFAKLKELFAGLNLGDDSHALVVDKSGNIQFNSDNNTLSADSIQILINKLGPISEFSGIQKIQNNKYLISIKELKDTDFYVLFCVPISNLTKVSNGIGLVTLIVFVLCIILSIFLAMILSTAFTKPIIKLTKYMSEASEGEFTSVGPIRGSREIKILYTKFVEMMTKIDRLIIENNEKNLLKRKAELYALQAQINPHFLYNTLNSINAMAILVGARDIMKMTTSLANLFRTSVSKEAEFVSISDEILHVKSYLDIQKIRYKDKFVTRFDIDEGIMSNKIVKLVLQPLVENSIYHGLEIKDGSGLIIIKGYAKKDKLILDIIDDGIGIDRGRLRNIRKQLINGQAEIVLSIEKRSVGIFNVNQRLKLYYGEEYGIRISSKKDTGTRVRIIIPKEQ